MTAEKNPLEKLREPFPAGTVGKVPKPYKNDSPRAKCNECGGFHGMPAMHLDYVGHAAVTDRLLTVDPLWNWEPFATDEVGLPALDRHGNLWIRLTIAGVTRIGVGDGSSLKEAIGDCLVTGTAVQTDRGVLAVEDVSVGDLVPTRHGWRPVTDAWLSSDSAPTVSVLLADGRVLQGTPHHKVATLRGPVRMGALRNADIMLVWLGTGEPQDHSRSSGTAGSTAACPITPIGTGASTSWQPQSPGRTYTATSTKRPTDRSRAGSTFTISTTIPLTTGLRTWLRSHRKHTPSCMGANSGASGTNAMSVEETSSHLVHGLVGALPPASNAAADEKELLTFDRESDTWQNLVSARNAEQGSSPGSHGPSFAPVAVVAVLDAGAAQVWNLSVGETHEYVANGLLVSNSIRNAAMRFGVALDLWSKEELESGHVEVRPDAPDPLMVARDRVQAAYTGSEPFTKWLKENQTRESWADVKTVQALADLMEQTKADTP